MDIVDFLSLDFSTITIVQLHHQMQLMTFKIQQQLVASNRTIFSANRSRQKHHLTKENFSDIIYT
jgi:hypothetical protein